MLKKILLIIVSFFISINVYATDACTTSELNRLKELANNVQFKKNYRIIEDKEENAIDVMYNIDIINYDKDLRIFYKTQYDDEETEVFQREDNIGDFSPTENVTFYIRAFSNNDCITKLLKSVTIKLPAYNEYYYFHKEKCDTYPDFKYCSEFLDTELSDEEIDKLFDEYLKKDEKTDNEKKEFNYIYIVILGVLLLLTIIVVVIIKNKRNKDDL